MELIYTATEKYDGFVTELEAETKRKIKNFILRERPELSRNKDNHQDVAILDQVANDWYAAYKNELTLGKELVGKVKNYAQNDLKQDPNKILSISDGLVCTAFQEIFAE